MQIKTSKSWVSPFILTFFALGTCELAFSAPDAEPWVPEGKFELSEKLPEVITSEMATSVLQAANETLQRTLSDAHSGSQLELGKDDTQDSFPGFTNIDFLWNQSGDQKVYTKALEVIGNQYLRAAHTYIDILTLVGRLETIKNLAGPSKDFKNVQVAYLSSIIPKYNEFIREFVFTNEKLIELIKTCTTYECTAEISGAQKQLIEYGRFLNKTKHRPEPGQFHPLLKRALEELEYRIAITSSDDSAPNYYRILFKTVLDTFRSDLDALLTSGLDRNGGVESPLTFALGLGNLFSSKSIPHISDPVIKSELNIVRDTKENVAAHIANNQIPLQSFKKKPKYYHHTLICRGIDVPGITHLFVAGASNFNCTSQNDQSILRGFILNLGPGLYFRGLTGGVISIDSLSPITPYGHWSGPFVGAGVMGGGQVVTALGKDGSFLQAYFMDVGIGAAGGLSVIKLSRPKVKPAVIPTATQTPAVIQTPAVNPAAIQSLAVAPAVNEVSGTVKQLE